MWNGRRVWVVGASSGIGEALALQLSEAGARLVVSARRTERLQALADRAAGPVQVLPLDLERPDTLEAAAASVWATYDGLDTVILNAGVAHRDLAEHTAMDVDRRLMEIDYFGPIALTKALLPRFLEQGHGQIGVTSSLSGKYGVPRVTAYAAPKHALHGFFESLRPEVADRGIDITLVIPGFVHTDITRKALEGDGTPHGRMLAVQSEGLSPERCARGYLRALGRRRPEAAIGGTGRISLLLHRLFPRTWASILRNHPVRRLRSLQRLLRLREDPPPEPPAASPGASP